MIPPGAVGNIRPIPQVIEVWRSEDVALPLLTKSSDALNGEHRQSYRTIINGGHVDSSLFVTPPDFQVTELTSEPASGSKRPN